MQAVDLGAGALGQVGVDPARQDGVGLDVVGGPGHRAGAGELHDAALAGGIGRREAGAEDRQHRADIDDLAAAGRLHGWVGCLRAHERAGEVGRNDAVPLLEFERVRRFSNIDAGIVDENVDAAELFGDAFDHGSDISLVGDVGGDRDRPDAARLELGGRGGRFRFIAADHRDVGAGFRQPPRHAEPDAAIAAGDDSHLAAEIEQFGWHWCHPVQARRSNKFDVVPANAGTHSHRC